jgi:uncharacterized Zn-finger protein
VSGICSKHQGECPADCDVTYGERACPICGKVYKPHYAYRRKAPVCDPYSTCGGAWDERQEMAEELAKYKRDHEAMELLRNAKPGVYIELARYKQNEFECDGCWGTDPADVIFVALMEEQK